MNNEILDKIDNIINEIKKSEDYKNYLYLKEKLSKNEKAKELIKNIKLKQKQLIKEQVHNNDTKDLDNEINDMLDKLNKIPLYTDFIETQKRLDNIYQMIKETLDDYFYEKLN